MKSSLTRTLLIVTLTSSGLALIGRAATDAGPPAAPNSPDLAVDAKATDADSWERIKDFPYEKRTDFIASLSRMSDRLGRRVREINAKVTDLPYAAAQKREAAMKEFDDARDYLKSQLTDLATVTADTWVDAKGSVVVAWQRVQAVYDKVKSSPTA